MNHQGFDKYLGYKIETVNEDSAILTLDIKSHHLNIHGYVHGGVYYSLSDAASGVVTTQHGENWVTLNSSINYLKGVKEGQLEVQAKLINKTRKTAIMEVNIYSNRTLLTIGTFTMYLVN